MGWNMDKEDLKDIIEKNKDELFSEIAQEINNDNVTDIEWDGYNLWITELGIGSYISGKELSDRYVENVSIKLANIMGVSFNRSRPILEANTEKLRISIWHESRCHKKSMSIRKIPEYLRFSHKDLVESDYAPESIINLLENTFIRDIEADPSDIKPYYEFLSEYGQTDIMSTVRTLYSVSELPDNQVDETINSLIQRNNELINKQSEIAYKDRISLFKFMEYIPVFLMALKMSVDMMLVITLYL